MLAEILGVVEKTNTRIALIIFTGILMYSFLGDGDNIADPASWNSIALFLFIPGAYLFVTIWVEWVGKLNDSLPENDMASWGPMMGGAVLAFCLLISFYQLSNNPNVLTFSILAKKNFLRLCALYLFGFETTKIKR